MFVSKLFAKLVSRDAVAAAPPSQHAALDVQALLSSLRLNGRAKRSRLVGTTPKSVTGQVSSFCAEVNPRAEPVYLAVHPAEGARANWCYDNVRQLVREQGGRIVFGWAIWIVPHLYIEAEHHAVHEDAAGKLRDVSPRPDGEKRVLFLRHDAEAFNFWTRATRPNKRRALDRHPAVLEFLACADAFDGLRLSGGKGISRSPGGLIEHAQRIAAAQVGFNAYARKKRR